MKTALQSMAMVLITLAASACATSRPEVKNALLPHGDESHPLFVGTSINGETVVASTHYDAMNGLAVRAEDLALAGTDSLTCIREMLTGTHVPAWYCRYDKEAAARREATQFALANPGGRASVDFLGPTHRRKEY